MKNVAFAMTNEAFEVSNEAFEMGNEAFEAQNVVHRRRVRPGTSMLQQQVRRKRKWHIFQLVRQRYSL